MRTGINLSWVSSSAQSLGCKNITFLTYYSAVHSTYIIIQLLVVHGIISEFPEEVQEDQIHQL